MNMVFETIFLSDPNSGRYDSQNSQSILPLLTSRCQQPSRTMPAKASLPSALVEAPMQATDIEKQSKNSRSALLDILPGKM